MKLLISTLATVFQNGELLSRGTEVVDAEHCTQEDNYFVHRDGDTVTLLPVASTTQTCVQNAKEQG